MKDARTRDRSAPRLSGIALLNSVVKRDFEQRSKPQGMDASLFWEMHHIVTKADRNLSLGEVRKYKERSKHVANQ